MSKTKSSSIKKQLLLLVFTAVLPIFLFSMLLVGYVAEQQENSLAESLMGTTRALSTGIEQEITTIESNLQMLAVLEDFDAARMPDLYRRLRKFLKSQEGWSSISLASLDGEVIMNSRLEYGATSFNLHDQDFFQEVLMTGKPTVSGFRIGKITGQPVFSVAVPVKVGGKISLILTGTVLLEVLSQKLALQKLPPNWTCAIVDQKGQIIARSRDHHKYVGQLATPKLNEKIKTSNEGVINDLNKEGIPTFASFKKLPVTHWSVIVGMPESETFLPSFKMFWTLLGGGILLVLVGVFISLLIAKKISHAMMELSQSAQQLGKREHLPQIASNLIEVNNVAFALENAAIEREDYDKMMKELYVQAQQAIEIRDSFLSVASHELKTPLTTLSLQAEILKRCLKDDFTPERVGTAVSRITTQLRRLTNLIDDLLDITKINAGKLDIRLERMDFVKIVRDILQNFEIESKEVSIHFEGPESIIGNFDRNRLEQVFTNLLSNAIKYGDGKPIEVKVLNQHEYAIFVIKDSGLGIAEENQAKIFERFERIVQNNNIRGLGLGLWIVKRIVEHLSGTIEVQSDGLGKGSTFTVKIPV